VPITLTETEFEVAWEVLGLGDLPLIFRVRVNRHGLTEQERSQVIGEAMNGLGQRRLADAHGVSPELADGLTLLANPRWVVDARLDIGRPVRAYGACGRGDSAALATLDRGLVAITAASRSRLPAQVASLAGDLAPGPGRSINLPAEALLAASQRCGGDSHVLGDVLIERGVPVRDARTVARLNEEMFGAGQFGVEAAGLDGTLRRAPRVVGFCDSPQGRWAQLRTAGADGREWITFTPARLTQLSAMISDLLAEIGVRAA
jgi:ESX secretion-associated protein EspG